MDGKKRKYGVGIWVLGFGYFIFYTPYSGLTKAITKGLMPAGNGPVSGFELLPLSVLASVGGILTFITVMGWWKYAGRRKVLGLSVPVPSRATFFSGLCTSVIIGTTTLAFSFSGASILFALVLLRGGVLIIGPVVDRSLGRRVRWFSWAALLVSLLSLLVVLTDVSNYTLGLIAILDIAAYLAAYFFRFRLMTRLAKSGDQQTTMRYFVEEQIVATPALLAMLGVLAVIGSGPIMLGFRAGFTTFIVSKAAGPAILMGLSYAALMICTTFIFLDRRENTFCVPMHCGSSMLSGVAASAALQYFYQEQGASTAQLASAGLIVVALAFLSPLHHVKDKLEAALAAGRLRFLIFVAGGAGRVMNSASSRITQASRSAGSVTSDLGRLCRVFLFVCSGNTCRSPLAEAIGNAEIAKRLRISPDDMSHPPARALSAGLTARPGAPLTPEAAAALDGLSVRAPGHGSRQLTAEMIHEAEVVYCMSRAHRDAVVEMLPSAAAKTTCLDPDGDIEDPIGGGAEVYAKCALRIQNLVRWRLDEAGIAA